MIVVKAYRSFLWACNGLKTVWREEHNFRIETAATIAVLGAALYLRLGAGEIAALLVAIVMVLAAEIVNTAIEDICNKIQPEYDPVIGKIKDTMAAYVLISVGGAALIGLLVFGTHFGVI